MKERAYIGTKIVLAHPEERNGIAGYALMYPDGYRSWSPATTFEDAYREISPAETVLVEQGAQS